MMPPNAERLDRLSTPTLVAQAGIWARPFGASRSRAFLFFLALYCSAKLAACAFYTRPVESGERLHPEDAFLYGRFKINATKAGGFAYQTMGFVIRCGPKDRYVIGFDVEHRVQVIKIKPGRCALVASVFTNGNRMPGGVNNAPPGLLEPDVFERGRAYYIGDFFAVSTYETGLHETTKTWSVNVVKHDYERTTAEMRRAYPGVGRLPTEDRMIRTELVAPAGASYEGR